MASEDTDSGMESQVVSSKDLTPEKIKPDSDDEADLDEDETVSERLWGLTEMFPENIRNSTATIVQGTCNGLKGLYAFSRVSAWIFFSSSVVLFAPVLFEVERAQVEEMQRSHQKQVLLGPNSAMAGGTGLLPSSR